MDYLYMTQQATVKSISKGREYSKTATSALIQYSFSRKGITEEMVKKELSKLDVTKLKYEIITTLKGCSADKKGAEPTLFCAVDGGSLPRYSKQLFKNFIGYIKACNADLKTVGKCVSSKVDTEMFRHAVATIVVYTVCKQLLDTNHVQKLDGLEILFLNTSWADIDGILGNKRLQKP